MEEMRFVGMEFFGNRPDDTHDASIDQVDRCEVLVGIIGFRHGSGITEAEYRRARQLGLPCFVYFKREDLSRPELTDGDPALAAKLAAFKSDLMRGHTVKEFSSPEELAANATADLHNWVAARWISLERDAGPVRAAPPDADRTNILRLLERIQHDWVEGVLEASLHHRAWLELGLDWKDSAVEQPWDRIVVAPNRPIRTLSTEDTITGVFASAQNTLLVLGEPGAGKTTTLLELARDLIKRARSSPTEAAPVVLALSTWTGKHRDFAEWLAVELGLRYQVPKRIAQAWVADARLVLLLDGLDEVPAERRAACVEAINAFEQSHHPPGLAVTCRVVEYEALTVKLRLRAAICLQPLTPEQIERYFAAAGAGLDHLRVTMREDEGLRELARTPLMLSVMTMAWHDAPAEGVRTAGAGTVEERRQQLFAAYVQAALNRRGKSAGGFSSEQTIRWLTWLAGRMKEHGHTLFAVEQLQPGWLGSAGRQFRYFMATRVIGTVGLSLPFLLWDFSLMTRVVIAALATGLGLIIGGIDYSLARHPPVKNTCESRRFWLLLAALPLVFVALIATTTYFMDPKQLVPEWFQVGLLYMVMAICAFCAPLDVAVQDVKPTDTMRWSLRLGLQRTLAGLAGMSLMVVGIFIITLISSVFFTIKEGHWSDILALLVQKPVLTGELVAALVVTIAWVKIRPKLNAMSIAVAIAGLSFGAQIGATFVVKHGWSFIAAEVAPALLVGALGGFATGMIDPARARRTGLWFWLRVPVLAFLGAGLLVAIPSFVDSGSSWPKMTAAQRWDEVWQTLVLGAGFGLVAFIRFGGVNGVQHYFLRWLLVRSGHLPAKPEAFFNHAAKLALLQKVGFGYRFIHALLLDHLAARPPEK
jgi:DNA polymerase III delta prime subunit